MGGFTITNSSQPVLCSDSNSNNITNITSFENTGLVDASMIVEALMLLGDRNGVSDHI